MTAKRAENCFQTKFLFRDLFLMLKTCTSIVPWQCGLIMATLTNDDPRVVITYGTFDLFHDGHRRILQRARELGTYLIVAVTSEGFDASRGKLNVRQTLAERISGVQNSGFADQIIVEEYEGQKINDVKKYHVDVFTVGSDWKGRLITSQPIVKWSTWNGQPVPRAPSCVVRCDLE